MRCFTRFFYCLFIYFLLCFHLRFGYQMLVSKTRVRTKMKCEKNETKPYVSPKRQFFSTLHYVLDKNASWLRFFLHFGMFEVTKTQTQHKM